MDRILEDEMIQEEKQEIPGQKSFYAVRNDGINT